MIIDMSIGSNTQPPNTLQPPWDRLSITGLASGAASAHGARDFLIDSPDRIQWDGSEPRRLSFQIFVDQARFFAAQMLTLGLTPGDRILILLPNCAEAAIAMIGARYAGLIPVLAPADETFDALRAGAERIEAVAIITIARVGSIRLGEIARQIAAKVMSVRCVAGFGDDLPEGVEWLDGWSEQEVNSLPPLVIYQADEALGTFQREEDGRLSVAFRSEAQVIAEALAIATAHKMDRSLGLIQTLHPGSAAHIAAGLIMPLFTGMTMRLVGPFQSDAFFETLLAGGEAILIAPAEFASRIAMLSAGEPRLDGLCGLIGLTRDPALILAGGNLPATTIFTLGEAALVVRSDHMTSLIGDHFHPMPEVLQDGVPCLSIEACLSIETKTSGFQARGFGAARILTRGGAARAA